MDSLIIKDLLFKYDNSSPVFNGWNCEVINSSFIQIKGKSGSGKTTLFKIISGFLPGKYEKLIVANSKLSVTDPPFQRNVAMVFQRSALWQHLTVKRNVRLAWNKKIISENILNKWIDILEIKGLLNKKSAELSAGEQQRVEIARALAAGKRNLILDEPFAFQDEKNKNNLIRTITEYREILKGVVLFSTHNANAEHHFPEQKTITIS